MVTDRYWENNPYFTGQAPGLVPVYGTYRGTETPYSAPKQSSSNARASGGFGNILGGLGNLGSGRFFKQGGNLNSGKLGQMFNKLASPEFDYTAKDGLTGWKNKAGQPLQIGKGLSWINAIANTAGAAQNFGDLTEANETGRDLVTDILNNAAISKTLNYDLDASQLELLRQLKSGANDGDTDLFEGLGNVDWTSTAGGALKGAVGGIAGGIPGMIAGAASGALNAGTESIANEQARTTAELEALLQAVQESAQSYKDIQKQRAYARMAMY